MVTEQNTYIHYNAAGQKRVYDVQTLYANGTQLREQTVYDGLVTYKGTSTSFSQAPPLIANYMHHPEGRIRISKTQEALEYTYEYHIKDQLGNIRVAFDAVQTGEWFQKEAVPFQYTNYYPFGMEHEPTYTMLTQGQEQGQQYKFNGKEFHTNIGWIDYGARFYNPALGRWHNVDPMAETYHTQSPYHFSGNNPVFFIEQNGMFYTPNGEEQADGNMTGGEYDFYENLEELAINATANISVLVDNLLKQSGIDVKGAGSKHRYGPGTNFTQEQAMDNAGQEWQGMYAQKSYDENREYISGVYSGSDDKGNYIWFDEAKKGKKYAAKPPKRTDGDNMVAVFHSHGRIRRDSDKFLSGVDINYAQGSSGNLRGQKRPPVTVYLLLPPSAQQASSKYIPFGYDGVSTSEISWEHARDKSYTNDIGQRIIPGTFIYLNY
jgi:RHS repeat-associated protein